MLDQPVKLLKAFVIQQELDPLARSHFAGGVLLLDARGATALLGLLLSIAKLIELRLLLLFLRRHQLNLRRYEFTTEDTEKSS
jgi:hypothetical protein